MLLRKLVVSLLLLAACTGPSPAQVRYEPTAPDVVHAMLELAQIRAHDLVADLGCGDGRIVIEAVRRHGARGLCVDLDPRRIAEATRNAREAGVFERIDFRNQDLFDTELRGVTVVMLFLSPRFNLQLRPKLQRELAPGARIVSHWHDMGDWPPERRVVLKSEGRERAVFLWRIP